MASWKDKLALIAQRNRQEIVKAKLDRSARCCASVCSLPVEA